MGKRTDFKRNERDFYPTPPEAVEPLITHIGDVFTFEEPCAGNGALIDALETQGLFCYYSSDIEPQRRDISKFNALDIEKTCAHAFITNPPWEWGLLSKIIGHLSSIAPTWLLLNADLMHNKRMAPYMKRCRKVVSVGRVSWMQNGIKGFENCAWYLFDKDETETIFVGRQP